MKISKLIVCALLLVACIMLSGCTPPTEKKCEKILQRNMNEISFLIDWFEGTTYTSVSFSSPVDMAVIESDGKITKVPLSGLGDEVRQCVVTLFNTKDYESIALDRDYNTAEFTMWVGLHEQACGIVYPLDPDSSWEVQFMTDSRPLAADGWFYFFCDYNEWRVNNGK